MTTPESLALLLSYPDAGEMFAGLDAVVIDELHALVGTKRGDLLALGLARLARLAPTCPPGRAFGDRVLARRARRLSRRQRRPHRPASPVRSPRSRSSPPRTNICRGPGIWRCTRCRRCTTRSGRTRRRWSSSIRGPRPSWRSRRCGGSTTTICAIGLHHGSLAVDQRRKIEKAVADGRLRAVVATSSLDLGIDWGSVDLVIQLGAPKGVSRLIQRIGRANHRLDKPSRAHAGAGQPLRVPRMPRRARGGPMPTRSTATRRGPAGSTCSPSTSSA